MLKYGSDKPDLRNPLVIADLTDEFNDPAVTFNAFKNVIKAGGVVRAIPAPGSATQPRSWFDKLNEWARAEMGAGGLGYIVFEGDEGKGPIAKFVPSEIQQRIRAKAGIGSGDTVFFAAGKSDSAGKLAGAARAKIADELGLVAKDRFEFCWIVDFPMYEWNEEEKKIDFSHNPFSMPNMEIAEFLALDAAGREKILSIKAIQYDIVCNGVELSSGAIRNHRPDVMRKAFAIAGYEETVLEQKFGGMLRALSLGAPPHGGIAPGIDRIVMLLAGEQNLREVVLFPMNQRAEDLMMGAPSEVSPKQLRELHIRLALPERG
jgi:aspartyl-tRNA synthetase